MHRQPVRHDGDELGVDLILVLLVILSFSFCSANALTRLSLSNSVNMTACFALRCRRINSRMYGMSATTVDSDCEARAESQSGHTPSLTQVLGRDIFQPRRPHCARTEDDLARARVERLTSVAFSSFWAHL